jgi:hypothetical protein
MTQSKQPAGGWNYFHLPAIVFLGRVEKKTKKVWNN